MPDTENTQQHNQNESEITPTPPTIVDVPNSDNEQVEEQIQQTSSDQPNTNQSDKKKAIWIWFKEPHPWISTIANIIMAIGAIAAVFISKWSLDASNKAVTLTQESIADGDYKDSQLIAATQKSANAAVKSTEIASGLLNEFKSEFQRDNEPYLQIKIVQAIISEGQPIIIRFHIPNLGKSPAKLISSNMAIMVSKDGSIDTTIKEDGGTMIYNSYINNESVERLFKTSGNIPAEFIKSICDEKGAIIFKGEMTYQNLTTMKKRRYKFVARIDYSKRNPEQSVYTMLKSDNYDIE